MWHLTYPRTYAALSSSSPLPLPRLIVSRVVFSARVYLSPVSPSFPLFPFSSAPSPLSLRTLLPGLLFSSFSFSHTALFLPFDPNLKEMV